MPKPILLITLFTGAFFAAAGFVRADPPNKIVGRWRMVSAQIDPDGRNLPAYGPAPNTLLVFTADGRSAFPSRSR